MMVLSKSGKVIINCDGISCDNRVVFEIPGWEGEREIDNGSNELYCPDCIEQGRWFAACCPGCVEDYPDCAFSLSFAYSKTRSLTEEQMGIIEGGHCPFRTNGTLLVHTYKGEVTRTDRIDLSEVAPPGSGKAITEAVMCYWQKYAKYHESQQKRSP